MTSNNVMTPVRVAYKNGAELSYMDPRPIGEIQAAHIAALAFRPTDAQISGEEDAFDRFPRGKVVSKEEGRRAGQVDAGQFPPP